MKSIRSVGLVLAILLVVLVPVVAVQTPSSTIEVGTFNLEWFSDGDWSTCPFAEKNNHRSSADIQALAQFIDQLGIEVLALQEIESSLALDKLVSYLPSGKYAYIISRQPDTCQRVAVLYQPNEVELNWAVEIDTSMGIWGLRDSLVVSGMVLPSGFDFTLVIVHLKAFSDSKSRSTRERQLDTLGRWIEGYLSDPSSEPDLLIVGDFNEHLLTDTYSFSLLDHGKGLYVLTRDVKTCLCTLPGRAYRDPITIIVISPNAEDEYIEGSGHWYNHFLDTSPLYQLFRSSEHCVLWASFSSENRD